MAGKKYAEEQLKAFKAYDPNSDRVVGCIFVFAAMVVLFFNIFLRYKDAEKSSAYKYTDGTVTFCQQTKRKYSYHRSRYVDSISVTFYPEGYDRKFFFRDSDGPYSFVSTGDVFRVYYKEDDPDECYIAKEDWITGKYIHADKSYNPVLGIVAVLTCVGLFFFADAARVTSRIKKGKLKAPE